MVEALPVIYLRYIIIVVVVIVVVNEPVVSFVHRSTYYVVLVH
jgi:hypothetical protein